MPACHEATRPQAAWCACRLAKQVSVFYEDVRRLLSAFPLNQHFDKSWLAHVTVKSLLYEVESMAQSATAVRAAEEVSGCAQEIARLKVTTCASEQHSCSYSRRWCSISGWLGLV